MKDGKEAGEEVGNGGGDVEASLVPGEAAERRVDASEV